jgi:hypothetical protein
VPNTVLTSKKRTDWPGTTEAASTAFGNDVNVVTHFSVVLKPSSAPRATNGSLKSLGSATGGLSVRSVVPRNTRLKGNGVTPALGLKSARV